MRRPPDAGTLDTLILGVDHAQEPEAWDALVRHPDGADAWQAAVARRRRLDRIALALCGRPWLARLALSVNQAARRLRSAPVLSLSALLSTSSQADLLGATLGPTEQEPAQ